MLSTDRKVVIIGAGSLGKMTASILVDAACPKDRIYFADDCILPGTKVLGFEVLGPIRFLEEKHEDDFDFIIAVAHNQTRKAIAELYPHLRYINAIHPSAVISAYADIGCGNIILPNVTVDPEAVVANHVVINKNCSIGHNVELENYTQVSPGSALGGHIEECAFLGLGTIVLPEVNVGKNAVIGAGSVVNRDIPDDCIAMGIPCKPVKTANPQKIG